MISALGKILVICALALSFVPRQAQAQPAPAPVAAAAAPVEIEVAPDSPRASMRRYFDLCRAGQFDEAAGYLELPPARRAEGGELARKLKAVLDRHLWIDIEALSPKPQGETDLRLPPGMQEVGKIPGKRPDPVRIVRRTVPGGGPRWIFSRTAVDRIDEWYDELEHRWIRENLPPILLQPGPKELLWWQWIAVPLLVIVGWALGFLFSNLTRHVLGRFVRRTVVSWDDKLLRRLGPPLTFAWGLLTVYVALPWLRLYPPAQEFLERMLRAGFFISIFWVLLRSTDILAAHVLVESRARYYPSARSLVPLLAKCAKIAILVMGAIAVISELGYPVASLIAGLGIGGVALALAAQKTVENLFGSVSIGIDRPFSVGDFVSIDGVIGTVESIGLRSTRIRTLDRTVVAMPNGKLAEMKVESFAPRDRIRLFCAIGLVYGTTAAQMRRVLAGFERVLREQPKLWPDNHVVRFKEFASSSLDIEIMAWFVADDFDDFRAIRQEVMLGFMEVVESAGTSFAFPTRTVHVVGPGDALAVEPRRSRPSAPELSANGP